jgi:hypothetical protein
VGPTWNGHSHLHLVPHEVTLDLPGRRFENCWWQLVILEAREPDSFRMLVTGDENWCVLEYQHSTKWNVSRGEIQTSARGTVRAKKVILTVV